mgnify:CR=1 FL=1
MACWCFHCLKYIPAMLFIMIGSAKDFAYLRDSVLAFSYILSASLYRHDVAAGP